MAKYQSVISMGLLGFAMLVGGAGCARPMAAPGELELALGTDADYTLAGRFQLTSIEPAGVSRSVDFDAGSSSVLLSLPPGAYALKLEPGARLGCPDAGSEPPHAVSAWPQRIAITRGRRTRAVLGVESPRYTHAALAASQGPCAASLLASHGAGQAQ